MAKSYVTEFVENVNKSRKNMINALKNKGAFAQSNDTLDALTQRINNLGTSSDYPTYERDANLPDIDTIFDNDPLRAVNGGEFIYVAYALVRLPYNNTATFSYATNSSVSKIVWSDGTEDKVTSKIIGDNGIYTATNGEKFCVCQIYYTKDVISGYTTNIDSYVPAFSYEIIWDASKYCNIGTLYLRYLRFVGSFSTIENPLQWSTFIGGGVQSPYNISCVRIDGYYSSTSIGSSSSYELPLETLIINGTGVSSTPVNVVGKNSVIKLKKLVLGNTVSATTSTVTPQYVLELFVSDSVSLLGSTATASRYWSSTIRKMHLGNGLTKIDSQYFYALEDLTLSEGTFGINTSAYTLDFSLSQNLSRQSVLNLFNNLADRTGMTANVLKLSTFTKTLVTDEEKAILTSKNWTLS